MIFFVHAAASEFGSETADSLSYSNVKMLRIDPRIIVGN